MAIGSELDAIVESARCSKKGVYFIGPFGVRVSFASQQRRALKVVWALSEKTVLKKDVRQKIAVIGGGIAGVTAAAALLSRGHEVHMFEREGDVLRLQKGAFHRMVHPNINFWPEEQLTWTTELPFFDWYAANSDEAVEAIERDWSGFNNRFDTYGGIKGELASFEGNKVVSDPQPIGDKVEILVDGTDRHHFDLVFMATGFGAESNLGDTDQKPYWKHDDLDNECLKTNFLIAVSGTGDGGVIDALRATYRDFMKEEIALRVIHIMQDKKFNLQITKIEEDARESISDSDEISESEREALAQYFKEKYTEVAWGLKQRAKALLPDLEPGKLPVTLIGERSAPFDLGVAPIHKLILAYTLLKERIEYRQGKLRRDDAKWILILPSGDEEEVAFNRVVVRHGGKAPAVALIGIDAAKRLEANQRRFADFNPSNLAQVHAHFEDWTYYPNRTTSGYRLACRRYALAVKFMHNRFGLRVAAFREAGNDNQGFFGYSEGDDTPRNLDHLPTKLFGFDLRKVSERSEQVNLLLDHGP